MSRLLGYGGDIYDGVKGVKGRKRVRGKLIFFLMFVYNLGLYIVNWGFYYSIFLCRNQYGAI